MDDNVQIKIVMKDGSAISPKMFLLLRKQLEIENTIYMAELDHEIAEKIGDKRQSDNAFERIRNARIALDIVDKHIEEIRDENVPDG
jgi:hypothetical protein